MFPESICTFIYCYWPYTLLLLMVYGLYVLLGYIVHKMRSNVDSTPFKSKAKKMFKVFLVIYLVPAIIALLFLLIYPQKTQTFMRELYWKIDDMQGTIEGWIMNHMFYSTVGASSLMSLIFLAFFLQQANTKPSIKTLVYFLLVSIPVISGILYLSCHVNIIVAIIIIGLPGALISSLKR